MSGAVARTLDGNADMHPIDHTDLRKALGSFATGVTVITTRVDGQLYGLTANSITSVSLSPPVLLFCIGCMRRTYDAVQSAKSFTVNVLSAEQRALSDRFASAHHDKWRALDYAEDDLGNVMFPGAAAVFGCLKRQTIQAGDHAIVLGEIVRYHQNVSADPLVYCRSRYCVATSMPGAGA